MPKPEALSTSPQNLRSLVFWQTTTGLTPSNPREAASRGSEGDTDRAKKFQADHRSPDRSKPSEDMLSQPNKEEVFTNTSGNVKAWMNTMRNAALISLNLDTTRWNQRWTSMKSLLIIFSASSRSCRWR